MCITHSYKKTTQFILIVLLIAVFAFPALTYAQTSTPTPREALIQAIEARAQRDVELERRPASISDMEALFGGEANVVGMTLTNVLEVYEEAYSAATPEKPWWADFQPKAGWIAAVILSFLLILHDVLKAYLTRFFKWLAETAYNQMAGYKPFWRVALGKYREALVKAHQELIIPIREKGGPLQMGEIYVPLKVAGSGDRNLVDAYAALGRHSRLMVVGAPGSGKTMLMRHIALTYAREGLRDFPAQPVPILLELHRLKDPNVPLLDQLVAVLKRHDFPNAQGFVKAGLKRGSLTLLFDGLDEVNQEARKRVVTQIRDLVQEEGRDCRVVVTCRTAVYNDEFAGWSDQHLEIVEFDDRQIQRFLSAWAPEMPAEKSVEHLLHTLRERPRIMALARNPLLLTIIASLYSDTAFVLPHSRAEFYEESTSILLAKWDRPKQKRNEYKAAYKRLVLQGLALYYQERAGTQSQDRRSAALTDVLAETKKMLPSLNLEATHAQPILDEIVERSGLLIALDEGTRYQFTHLTLQEFFAALALKDNPDQLVARFEADPGTWRETVKLWCGLEYDSTALIKAVAAADPITAIECLGDTQQVDSGYAAELIQSFRVRLGEPSLKQDVVAQALALVAADPRQRGEAVFNDLAATIASPEATPEVRLATAQVLSLTNLPQAADVLAKHAPRDPALRPLLAQMGNLAVPALVEWAAGGETWALDVLYTVGTPQASLALTPLLWSTDQKLQYQAAWRLGALLADSNIEAALNDFTLSPEQRSADYMDWVWAPFEPDPESPLRVVGGRVAHLLQAAPPDTHLSADSLLTIDPRLVIPLCTIKAKTRERLLKALPQPMRSDLQKRLKGDPTPTSADWRNIFRPIRYTFDKSLQSWGFKLGLFALVCLGLWKMGTTILLAPQLVTLENGFIFLLALTLAGGFLALSHASLDLDVDIFAVLCVGVFAAGPVIGPTVGALSGNWVTGAVVGAVGGALVGALGGTIGSAVVDIVGHKGEGDLILVLSALIGGAVGGALGGTIFDVGGALGVLFGVLSGVLFGSVFGVIVAVYVCYVIFEVLVVAVVSAGSGAVVVAVVGAVGGAVGGALAIALVVAFGVGFGVGFGVVVGGGFRGVSVGALIGTVAAPAVYFPTAWLYERLGWVGAGAFWAAWLVWMVGFLMWGVRLKRRARNPLQGLLDMDGAPEVKYRSVGRSHFALLKRTLPFFA